MNFNEFQVYVGNLSINSTDRSLSDYFISQGLEILHATVVLDLVGKSRGYGFVKFESSESAYKAVTAVSSRVKRAKEVDGNVPVVRETYQPTRAEIARGVDHPNGKTIFVGNLNPQAEEEQLRMAYSKFGYIVSCRTIPDRGFGFVTFSDHVGALAALSEMQDAEILHHRVYCCWARRDQQDEEEERVGRYTIGDADETDRGTHLFPTLINEKKPTVDDATEISRIELLKQARETLTVMEALSSSPKEPSVFERNEQYVLSRLRMDFSKFSINSNSS